MLRKIKGIFGVIFYIIFIMAIIYVGFAIFVPSKHNELSRYKTYVIISESMMPKINPLTLIIVDKKPTEAYIIDDIITFKHDINDDGNMEVVTHRVAEISDDKPPLYKTRPESKDRIDDWTISQHNIIGKVVFYIPYLGLLILALQKVAVPVLIILNLIILSLLILTLRKSQRS